MTMRKPDPTRTSSSGTELVKPRGPNHCAIILGSVHACHTSARGASNTREMMTSLLCVAPAVMGTPRYCLAFTRRLLHHQDHPVHAEFVGQHAEAWREERLAHRHGHLAAIAERAEQLVGFGFGLGGN